MHHGYHGLASTGGADQALRFAAQHGHRGPLLPRVDGGACALDQAGKGTCNAAQGNVQAVLRCSCARLCRCLYGCFERICRALRHLQPMLHNMQRC